MTCLCTSSLSFGAKRYMLRYTVCPSFCKEMACTVCLDGVKDVIKTSTKTLLEEPRAELTALHTMTLLEPAGLLSKVCCQPTLLPWLSCRGLTSFNCLRQT